MQARQWIGAFLVSALAAAGTEELTPTEIIRRSDDLLRGGRSFSELTMVISRPEWSRTVTMEAWTEGAANCFIRILSPAKDRGVTFLKRGREAWQHIPSIDRTIKIPPSMMLQSWMGSDFTNDDVVRADSLVTDYTHRVLEEPEENGVAWWVVEATPKPDAPVVWGKVVFRVRKSNFVPGRVDYYDEDGRIAKHYETSDIRNIEGKEVATHFIMHDDTRPGYSTAISYDKLTFSPEVEPDTFSLRNLER